MPFALFKYSSLSYDYVILTLSSAVTNLPNKNLIFHDFPGHENEILKFHDFPAFLRPVRTLSLLQKKLPAEQALGRNMREKTGHPTKTRESSSHASFFLAFITSKSLLSWLPENYFVYPTRVFLINVRGISGSIMLV